MYVASLVLVGILSQLSSTSAAPVVVGSTSIDVFPPNGTNVDTDLFPDRTVIGNPQVTRTGAQPYAFVTAPASQFPLVQQGYGSIFVPKVKGKTSPGFNPLYSWGYLTPRYSLPPDTWGADKAASPIIPDSCKLDAVHLLFRHGARYPTSGDDAEKFATRLLRAAEEGSFSAKGELSFLNDWTYKLGSDILNAFGRQQLYDLGVRSRVAYGHLLNDFTTKGELPVFRTGSIDRMVETMETFGQGFFGRDSDKQFSLEIAHELKGVNASVYPGGGTCPNSALDVTASKLGMAEYVNRTFADTAKRLQQDIKGYTLTPADVMAMTTLCAYETLSLGYSKFCPLFTEKDFKNMQYALDIMFYYGNGPGGQTTAAQGKGWVQEFLARLTHTPIAVYDSSTNSTLDGNPKTFPLNQTIYADASHDSYIMSTFVALNFSAINTFGMLPTNIGKSPEDRAFKSSSLVPFNTNLVAQVMTCKGEKDPQIRFILNDAVIPLDKTYAGCKEDRDGLCELDKVVAALQKRMEEIDYHKACNMPIVNVTETSQLKDGNGLPWQ